MQMRQENDCVEPLYGRLGLVAAIFGDGIGVVERLRTAEHGFRQFRCPLENEPGVHD